MKDEKGHGSDAHSTGVQNVGQPVPIPRKTTSTREEIYNREWGPVAMKAIVANGWHDPASGFTMGPARYAAGNLAVRPVGDGSGFKTPEQSIAGDHGRWSNREGAYMMTAPRAEKYAAAVKTMRDRRAKGEFG